LTHNFIVIIDEGGGRSKRYYREVFIGSVTSKKGVEQETLKGAEGKQKEINSALVEPACENEYALMLSYRRE